MTSPRSILETRSDRMLTLAVRLLVLGGALEIAKDVVLVLVMAAGSR